MGHGVVQPKVTTAQFVWRRRPLWASIMTRRSLTMSFKSFRDKMQWVALALAVALFALDWITRAHYVAFVNSQ